MRGSLNTAGVGVRWGSMDAHPATIIAINGIRRMAFIGIVPSSMGAPGHGSRPSDLTTVILTN